MGCKYFGWAGLLVGLLLACQPNPDQPGVSPTPASTLTIAYPFDGALFPPEIVAPTIRWTDNSAAARWRLDFKLPDGRILSRESLETRFRPDSRLWEELKQATQDRFLTLTITGLPQAPGQESLSAALLTFGTSSDPVGDSLFYREVILPFEQAMLDTPALRWRFGSIAREEQPPVVLTGLPVCANCHSFSKDGAILGMDVDYANDKGSYAMVRTGAQVSLEAKDIISWVSLDKADPTKTFGLLPQVSPDGRFVMATVKDQSIFVAVSNNLAYSQLFFPTKGVLGWYDRQESRFGKLPGASAPDLVQANPVWSPDGQELLFARAKAYDISRLLTLGVSVLTPKDVPEFFGGGQKFKYDLYRIPFNGGAGGTPVPVPGASNNGKSNYFPRFSPDGKWLVFCQADSFMLLQPDANLFILPAAGGTPRKLRANRDSMNSWHSWSSNSRWLVFSSKINGPYTQLFLTHIDAEGNDSPPVLLEQFTAPERAANIPEFVALPPDHIKEITTGFVPGDSYYKRGLAIISHTQALGNREDLEKAEGLFTLALVQDPKHVQARNMQGLVLNALGRPEEAIKQWTEASRLDPDFAEPYLNLGLLHEESGRFDLAQPLFEKVTKLDPSNLKARMSLAAIRLRTGQTQGVAEELEALVKLKPDWYPALFHLGVLKKGAGDLEAALDLFKRALAADSDNPEAHWYLGVLCLATDRTKEAVAAMTAASERFPEDPNLVDVLAIAQAAAGDFQAARNSAVKAMELARATGQAGLIDYIGAHEREIRAQRVPRL